MTSIAIRDAEPGAADSGELLWFDTAPPGAFEAMFDALDASSAAIIGPSTAHLLVIPIHDDTGCVSGGLWGHTQFGWLNIEMLIVPLAQRGRGIGSGLMRLAESAARSRGCIGVHLDTFSFQAAPFYEKLGFTVYGVLDEFPPGHQRLFFQKRLGTPSGRPR